MIGLVIVSHSARLAEGVCELAAQMAQGKVRLAPAGGTDDPQSPIGTDPVKVLAAIESVYDPDGVILLADLGSAVLSAETALELLDEPRRARVRLSPASLVEGAVAAAALAAAGAGLDEVLQGASGRTAPSADAAERLVTIGNPIGLHARPAAQLVRLARGFGAPVTMENLSHPAPPADATAIQAVLALRARQGHQLRLRGPRAAIDAIAAFLESSVDTPPAAQENLAGQAASAGVAIGPLFRLKPAPIAVPDEEAEDPQAELHRLDTALEAARAETRSLYDWTRAHIGKNEAGIFDAQLLFLEDPALIDRAQELIRHHHATAARAWQTASAESIAELEALDDAYLRARAADVADVAARLLRVLTGATAAAALPPVPSIVAARDLTPSEVRTLDPAVVLGLCLEAGSPTAHSVILARAMGIPAVVGLGPGLAALEDGVVVAIDCERGQTWIAPTQDQLREIEARRQAWQESVRAAREARHRPAVTADGRRLRVFANIGAVAEAGDALASGADGVGVLRTEFLFLNRAEAPSEDEQYAAYRAIADVLGDRPLVIRTLDAGGDKNLPYLAIGAEPNPFLGWRGIRLTLGSPALLRAQLRAIVRAAAHRNVEVLFPMVSSLAEFREARAALREVEAGLGVTNPLRAGVMIEVPAAVAIADQLAREAAFFSIGTNDLAQYTMAADRTNARVAALADALDPAVLRMVRQTVEAARAAGIPATLCGELAADPLATPLLIGLGLEEFSVSPPLIGALKRAIAQTRGEPAAALARQVLDLDSSQAVRRFLADWRPVPE
jgi:phosphocarrier protein FPr